MKITIPDTIRDSSLQNDTLSPGQVRIIQDPPDTLKWTQSDTRGAQYVGQIEFRDIKGEFHSFEVLGTTDRLIFGGACNAGFLESGFIRRDDGEHTDDTLQEMLSDLEVYYNNGPRYTSRIVCNERM